MIKSVAAIQKQDNLSASKLGGIKNNTSVGGISAEELSKLIPPRLKAKGKDKINEIIQSKVDQLSDKIVPRLTDLADRLGIQSIGAFPPTFPKICPTPQLIDRVLNVRNSIVTTINSTFKYLNLMLSAVGGFTFLLRTYTTVLKGLQIIQTVELIAVAAQPVANGASVAALTQKINTINKQVEKNNKLAGSVDAITLAIGLLKTTLVKVIDLLNKIDSFLRRCMTEQQNTTPMVALDVQAVVLQEDEAINTNPNTVDTTYNGFVLEVVKKPYGNGLTQSVGIAKNQSGIILLQTEPSFTLNPQSLIDELKLKIDSENLVGY